MENVSKFLSALAITNFVGTMLYIIVNDTPITIVVSAMVFLSMLVFLFSDLEDE